MALSNLKLKLKSDLKKTVEDSSQGRKNDMRLLNYFDLKDGERMRILLIPDINGELWAKWKFHAGGKDMKGVKPIRCKHEALGEECPVCQEGFKLNDAFNDTGDKSYKEAAKNWWGRDRTLMSCLVLESPCDINQTEDKNEVKLFIVPYGIESRIRNAIMEGEIDEDLLFQTPFVIKKGKNSGGFASYDDSYFARNTVTDEDLEYFEDRVIEQFDYSTIDLIHEVPDDDAYDEWVENMHKRINQGDDDSKTTGRSTRTRGKADDDDDDEPRRTRSAPRGDDDDDEPRRGRSSARSDDDDDEPRRSEQKEEEEPRKEKLKSGGSLRDRLRNAQG
tara:strand:- start:136 stop:1134 length:999 start_codon:yes stop_codon:yes gene_type:complete